LNHFIDLLHKIMYIELQHNIGTHLEYVPYLRYTAFR